MTASKSKDLLSIVMEAAAAHGPADLVDLHLALAAIAYELRTANLIAAKGILSNTAGARETVDSNIAARLGSKLPGPTSAIAGLRPPTSGIDGLRRPK